MPDVVILILALVGVAATLAAAVAHRPRVPDGVVALVAAAVVVAVGGVSWGEVREVVEELAPSLGFLVALLLLAEGCRREGLFEAAGRWMASGAPAARRLLARAFLLAAATTVVLSLDATVVLLTPVVLVTARRLRTDAVPVSLACVHLANSASLLLPISNLTNLIAFHAVDLSFARFAALMALPFLVALAVEWVVLARRTGPTTEEEPAPPHEPVAVLCFALAVVVLTLAGCAAASALDVEPVWAALAGAVALTAPALARRDAGPRTLLSAAQPNLVVLVLGLGVVVAAASEHGIGDLVDTLLPQGDSLPALLAVAAVAALLANLVNNLPATLVVIPIAAAGGPAPVLAALIGLNAGPNLTPQGSLATLLWRRVTKGTQGAVADATFVRLGAVVTPLVVGGATTALWLALRLGV